MQKVCCVRVQARHSTACSRPAAARSNRCFAFAVARPTRKVSYPDLIQAHERAERDGLGSSSSMGSNFAHTTPSRPSGPQPARYLSDPAVYLDRNVMLQQLQGTVQQVVTVSKQAVGELAAAFDPKQARSSREQPLGIPANAVDPNFGNAAAGFKPQQQPQPLQALSRQAVRLTQALSEDVHNATQDVYHRYGPHLTAAGVRLVGKAAAAAGVEIIGKDNTAKAIGQLGSTNAAAATEELGVAGVLKVARRLGPVGLAKVIAKLGPRGTLNMGSHILARTADGFRAQAARLNPTEQSHDDVDAVLTQLQAYDNSSSSSSSSRGNSADTRGSSAAGDVGRGSRVPPVVALGVAMMQVLLHAVAGMLQGMSNVLKNAVKLWDAKHQPRTRHDRHDSSSAAAADDRTETLDVYAAQISQAQAAVHQS